MYLSADSNIVLRAASLYLELQHNAPIQITALLRGAGLRIGSKLASCRIGKLRWNALKNCWMHCKSLQDICVSLTNSTFPGNWSKRTMAIRYPLARSEFSSFRHAGSLAKLWSANIYPSGRTKIIYWTNMRWRRKRRRESIRTCIYPVCCWWIIFRRIIFRNRSPGPRSNIVGRVVAILDMSLSQITDIKSILVLHTCFISWAKSVYLLANRASQPG